MNLIFIFVTLYIRAFFENLPVLPYRLGRLHISLQTSPFSEGKGCANSPFNSLYALFGSPYRGQKRYSNRYAIWLADHQRSTPAAELLFLCGDEPAFTQGFAKSFCPFR